MVTLIWVEGRGRPPTLGGPVYDRDGVLFLDPPEVLDLNVDQHNGLQSAKKQKMMSWGKGSWEDIP